jgi:hypothetical protein
MVKNSARGCVDSVSIDGVHLVRLDHSRDCLDLNVAGETACDCLGKMLLPIKSIDSVVATYLNLMFFLLTNVPQTLFLIYFLVQPNMRLTAF